MAVNLTQRFSLFILEKKGSRHLSTLVAYTSTRSQCYAPISNSLWAHIKPVVYNVMQNSEHKIETLHILSEGPVTPYRNRANCFLLSSIPYTWGLKCLIWNYSERAHGKGAPDGVGRAVTQMADNYVLGGKDIQTPKNILYEFLINREVEKIQFEWIDGTDIQVFD